jgi:hypothetical protein
MPLLTPAATGDAAWDDYTDAQLEELLDALDPAELELAETIARQLFQQLSERAIASIADRVRRLSHEERKGERAPAGHHF